MKSHLNRLRFRHLLLIETLGATRSLRKAAEKLAMTQPGCSKLLRELERELGAVLFERTASGVSPTPYGDVMIRTAHLIVAQANFALDEMETLAGGAQVRVRVGMFGVALTEFVADVVQRMHELSFRSVIALEEGSAERLLTALGKGDVDCVIGRGNQMLDLPGLRHTPLFLESVSLVGRRNHPLARRKRIALKEVAALEWLLPAPGTVLRQRINRCSPSITCRCRAARSNRQPTASTRPCCRWATGSRFFPIAWPGRSPLPNPYRS